MMDTQPDPTPVAASLRKTPGGVPARKGHGSANAHKDDETRRHVQQKLKAEENRIMQDPEKKICWLGRGHLNDECTAFNEGFVTEDAFIANQSARGFMGIKSKCAHDVLRFLEKNMYSIQAENKGMTNPNGKISYGWYGVVDKTSKKGWIASDHTMASALHEKNGDRARKGGKNCNEIRAWMQNTVKDVTIVDEN